MSACCNESDCRRTQPILIRRTPFSEQWVAITRYTRKDGTIRASEKHVLDEQAQTMLNGAFIPPDKVAQDRTDAVRHAAGRVSGLLKHLGIDPDRRAASGHTFAQTIAATALNIPLASAESGGSQ